jgi:hypothetical protein
MLSSKAEQHRIDMGVSCVAGHRLPDLWNIYMRSVGFLGCRSLSAHLLFALAPLAVAKPLALPRGALRPALDPTPR